MSTRVTLIRDARLSLDLYPHNNEALTLRGRLVKSWGRSGRVRFYVLQDVSGLIQIVLERNESDPTIWDAFTSLSPGVGVSATGTLGRSNNGTLSLFPITPPVLLPPLGEVDLLAEDTSGVATQVLLGRLETLLRERFTERGHVELTPRYLSSTWPEDGLQPLRVQFAGQSIVPLLLAVSPVPQLLRALLAVGDSSFCVISRTFATNFVANQNGAEAVVGASLEIHHDILSQSNTVLELVQGLLSAPETLPSEDLQSDWVSTPSTSESSTLALDGEPERLHLHKCTEPMQMTGPGGFKVGRAYQVHWQSSLVIAEGYELMISQTLPAVVTVVYLERCLQILRTQDNRRIRDVANPRTADDGRDEDLSSKANRS